MTGCISFHNNLVKFIDLWRNSHQELIEKICFALDCPDRIPELALKFLGDPLKVKTKKDPNLPKRAKSAYFFFCGEIRPNLIKDLRKKKCTIDIAAISKILGKKWQGLSNKSTYNVMAAADKQRYIREMEVYQDNKHVQ